MLVDEVVAVATGGAPDEPATTFDLVDVARELVQRFERRTGRAFVLDGTTEHRHRAAIRGPPSDLLSVGERDQVRHE